MRFSEIASRYARALFEIAHEESNQENTYSELSALADILKNDSQIAEYLTSPMVKTTDKEAAINTALAGSKISDSTKNFLLLLARKDRVGLVPEIVAAFQSRADAEHGVTRGDVRSAGTLGSGEREQLEKTVEKFTGKKVILSYKEDPTLIGGVVAKVGSFTFNDSLTSHLTRLKEDINRRTQ